eukprot:TRINITY_DN678_c0_g7_i1.p1 TRINITY_DN678_c0_g7~~TRINITY_DN678_c0_g7_i1.p1  ORF type:complete len:167 (+),score=18.56 TRINITY_DN678_c0_g7_i1:268-768(+)
MEKKTQWLKKVSSVTREQFAQELSNGQPLLLTKLLPNLDLTLETLVKRFGEKPVQVSYIANNSEVQKIQSKTFSSFVSEAQAYRGEGLTPYLQNFDLMAWDPTIREKINTRHLSFMARFLVPEGPERDLITTIPITSLHVYSVKSFSFWYHLINTIWLIITPETLY